MPVIKELSDYLHLVIAGRHQTYVSHICHLNFVQGTQHLGEFILLKDTLLCLFLSLVAVHIKLKFDEIAI